MSRSLRSVVFDSLEQSTSEINTAPDELQEKPYQKLSTILKLFESDDESDDGMDHDQLLLSDDIEQSPKINKPSIVEIKREKSLNIVNFPEVIDLTQNDDATVQIKTKKIKLEKSPVNVIQHSTTNTNVSSGSGSSSQLQLLLNTTEQSQDIIKQTPSLNKPVPLNNNKQSQKGLLTIPSTIRMEREKTLNIINKILKKDEDIKRKRKLVIEHSTINTNVLSGSSSSQLLRLNQLSTDNNPNALTNVSANSVRPRMLMKSNMNNGIPVQRLSCVIPNSQLRPVPPAVLIDSAPLPLIPNQRSYPTWKLSPPAPTISLNLKSSNVLLIWNMLLDNKYEDISNYEIFCYCESQIPFPYSNAWLKLKKVTALPLPMACTIQQVFPHVTYFFTVRAIDIHYRVGPFSSPIRIKLELITDT